MLAPFALSFTVVLVFAKILDEMMVEQERLLLAVGIDYSPEARSTYIWSVEKGR